MPYVDICEECRNKLGVIKIQHIKGSIAIVCQFCAEQLLKSSNYKLYEEVKSFQVPDCFNAGPIK